MVDANGIAKEGTDPFELSEASNAFHVVDFPKLLKSEIQPSGNGEPPSEIECQKSRVRTKRCQKNEKTRMTREAERLLMASAKEEEKTHKIQTNKN